MDEVIVSFERINRNLTPPEYFSDGSSGIDLRASITNSFSLRPGERQLIPTGIRLEIPEGYEGQVRPRSGIARDSGVTVLNTPGTIDSDYRGEVSVVLINLGQRDYVVEIGDRIAQLIIAPVVRIRLIEAAVRESLRGNEGFGSTGLT